MHIYIYIRLFQKIDHYIIDSHPLVTNMKTISIYFLYEAREKIVLFALLTFA